MPVLPQQHDLHWGHWSRDRFAELASEEETLVRDVAECTSDKLKGNYSSSKIKVKIVHQMKLKSR